MSILYPEKNKTGLFTPADIKWYHRLFVRLKLRPRFVFYSFQFKSAIISPNTVVEVNVEE